MKARQESDQREGLSSRGVLSAAMVACALRTAGLEWTGHGAQEQHQHTDGEGRLCTRSTVEGVGSLTSACLNYITELWQYVCM